MEEVKEISKAMALAFPEIGKAGFDKENPHFKSKYASLGAIVEAIKPALSKNGLWFMQRIVPQPGFAAVETVIVHTSGESLSCGTTAVPIGKNDAQGYGSALTYAKRYSLSSAFGVVSDEDDDGNSACSPSNQPQYPQNKASGKTQVQRSPLPSVPADEMKLLAARVIVEMSNDPFLKCSIDPEDMVEWLSYCQSKAGGDIRSSVDSLLASDKQKLLSSFEGWIAKRDALMA